MINIAILASGSGSNAENIVSYFRNNKVAHVKLILTNNPNAGVVDRAKKLNIHCEVIEKNRFNDGKSVSELLKKENIDFLVLAGFLLLVPPSIITNFKDRIINIHPALLPNHGGKGFYGSNVHKSVIDSGAFMSGITIHHVNEKFDDGEIIFQAACHVSKIETPESLAQKIHALEYAYFPIVIEKLLNQQHTHS
jgi:phosphoribosylglycinamide formyltransferase-1